jgi:hypothetical protein
MRKKDPSLCLAMLIGHSSVGARVDLDPKRSLSTEVSIDIVDEFVSSVARAEASLTGDTVTRIRSEEDGGIVPGSADIAFGSIGLDGHIIIGSQEREISKVEPDIVDEGIRQATIRPKPEGPLENP